MIQLQSDNTLKKKLKLEGMSDLFLVTVLPLVSWFLHCVYITVIDISFIFLNLILGSIKSIQLSMIYSVYQHYLIAFR